MSRFHSLLLIIVCLTVSLGACLLYHQEPYRIDFPNIDFGLRYNEVSAVLQEKDPYLIRTGGLPRGEFTPFSWKLLGKAETVRLMAGYMPWVYSFMLPFGFLEKSTAERVYFLLELLGLGVFLVLGLKRIGHFCQASNTHLTVALTFMMMVLASSDYVIHCLHVGNFGVLITVAAFFALVCHDRRWDVLAGVFWCVTAFKPQLGALFFLVLLLERKWKTLCVSGAMLGGATILSAVLCRRSPIAMVLEVFANETGQYFWMGLSLGPANCYVGSLVSSAICALIGILICVYTWSLLRRCPSVFVRFLPPTVLCLVWANYRLHDLSIQSLGVLMFAEAALVLPLLRQKVLAVVGCVLLVVRAFVHFVPACWVLPVNVVCILILIALGLLWVRPSLLDQIRSSVLLRKWWRIGATVLLFTIIFVQFKTYRASTYGTDVDFRMRYYEAECVRGGRDPFLVWKGELPSGKYTPWGFQHYGDYQKHKLIHAYTPWTYTLMMPFTFLSVEDAGIVYLTVEILALIALFGYVFGSVRRRTGSSVMALAVVALLTATSDPMIRCAIVGNFGILITVFAFAALALQNRGHERLAGVFWALTLVKPQIGGLFFLLLLFERRWKTVLVTSAMLILLSLPPALLCHRSPIDMVLAFREYSAGGFPGTGLFAPLTYVPLVKIFGESLVRGVSMGIGAVCCVWAAWFLRLEKSMFIRFLPAALLAIVWSTSRLHDYCILMLAFWGLVEFASAHKERDVRVVTGIVAGFVLLQLPAFFDPLFLVLANVAVLVGSLVLSYISYDSWKR